jgi:hypothetical protein
MRWCRWRRRRQSLGGALVSGIRGCFYNVMGFPMHRFCAELAALIDARAVLPAAAAAAGPAATPGGA